MTPVKLNGMKKEEKDFGTDVVYNLRIIRMQKDCDKHRSSNYILERNFLSN